MTEVLDALLNGLTFVGEREPLRVNAALERLLRHWLDESSSLAQIGFLKIESYMSPSAHQVDGTAASFCFCARHFTSDLLDGMTWSSYYFLLLGLYLVISLVCS